MIICKILFSYGQDIELRFKSYFKRISLILRRINSFEFEKKLGGEKNLHAFFCVFFWCFENVFTGDRSGKIYESYMFELLDIRATF